MKKLITLIICLYAGISGLHAQQYYCQPYYGDNKIRFYPMANPVAGSPSYTLDLSADIVNAWGENTNGPNDVVVYNNKLFVSFDLGDRGGVLIYNMADVYPARNTNHPIVIKPQVANGLSSAGIAINPANGDLFVPTFDDGTGDPGVFQYTAASNYATGSQFASLMNDESVASVCANLTFDGKGNLWMTTWSEDNDPAHHFLICYKGVDKNNYYKITNTPTASYSATDDNGNVVTGLNLLSAPEGIAFDPSGNLWLGNNNDFALTNGNGQGTLVKFTSSWINTLLSSPSTGESAGNPTYTPTGSQANILYIAGGKLGGITFNGSTMYLNDQGQNQGSDYTTNGTVWKWDVTTAFNTTNFKPSGINTTYPGNGGGSFFTAAASTDALLTSIKLTPASTLKIVTGPGYVNYTTTVASTINSIKVTATTQDATATIKINGVTTASGAPSASIPLAIGSNVINTVVTAQDGKTTKTYTITASRGSSDALLTSVKLTPTSTLKVVTGTSYVNYTTSVPNTTASVTVTAVEQDATATLKVNGVTVASGAASASIPLAVGSNVINIVSTAQDGVTTKTYTITATRAASADALLTSIKLTPASTLTVVTGPGYVNYTTTIAATTSSVTVTATEQDPTATLKVNGITTAPGAASAPITLADGSNTITIVSTAPDGVTTKTYIITATKPASANLSALKLSSGMLAPVFATATTSYTASVTNATASITVTPTAGDAAATIKVKGAVVTSGTASAAIPLIVGANTITTVVTDGAATKTYTVMVTRAASTDALLTSIKLTPASTLKVVAGPSYVNYTTSVPNTTSSVTVTANEQDATATLKVNGKVTPPGTASAPIALAVGSNTITIVSTAQDGITSKTYTITATRAAAGINNPDETLSVTKSTNIPTIESDGILVHQGVSPNGDGINDYLTIDNITSYPNNNLTIVDRNGAMVYQTRGYDNASKAFDGHSNINGKMQLPGTYFYSLDYAVNGQSLHKTGYIILKY